MTVPPRGLGAPEPIALPRFSGTADLTAMTQAVDALTDLPRQLKHYTDALSAEQEHRYRQLRDRRETAATSTALRGLAGAGSYPRMSRAGRVQARLHADGRLEVRIDPGPLTSARVRTLEADLRRVLDDLSATTAPPAPDAAIPADRRDALRSAAQPLVDAIAGVEGVGRDDRGFVDVRIGGAARMRLSLSSAVRGAVTTQMISRAVERSWSVAVADYTTAVEVAMTAFARERRSPAEQQSHEQEVRDA